MEGEINATIVAATREIVAAFNRLSTSGIKIRDVSIAGGSTVAWTTTTLFILSTSEI